MRYVLRNKFYILLITLVDFFGKIIFFPFKLFKKKKPGNIGSLLLIRLDHIGDVISSTPALENLKNHYRGAKITFLVASWARDIVINNPNVDEVICYDGPWFNRKRKKIFEFIRFFKLAGELRKHDYDMGFDLRGDFRHILLMALAGVHFRVGYGITGGGFLLHKQADYKKGIHSIEHNLDLLRAMNIKITTDKPRLYNSAKDNKFAEDFLKKNNIGDRDFVVIMHPYAGYPSKNWLDDRSIELLNILYKDYNAKTILVGSEKDNSRNNELVRMSKIPIMNIAGKTSLGALLALLRKASLFIGVDSAPSHIAALEGVPAVLLYSGTNSLEEWAPRSKQVTVIQKEIPCKGCAQLDCKDNICMDLISVDDVVESIEKVLA